MIDISKMEKVAECKHGNFISYFDKPFQYRSNIYGVYLIWFGLYGFYIGSSHRLNIRCYQHFKGCENNDNLPLLVDAYNKNNHCFTIFLLTNKENNSEPKEDDFIFFLKPNLNSKIPMSRNPTIGTLERIANAIGCKVVDFFQDEQAHFSAIIKYNGELKEVTSVGELEKFVIELKKEGK